MKKTLFEEVLLMSPEGSPATTGASPTPPASPAPAADTPAPAAPAGEEISDAGEESPVDWNAVDQLDGGDQEAAGGEGPAEAKPTPKAAPKAPGAPAAAPAVAPTTPTIPPVQVPAAAAPAAPAAAQPAPAVAPVAQPPAAAPAPAPAAAPAPAVETPEQKTAREAAERAAAEKQEKEVLDALVKEYGLPEDAVAKLSTEPEQVLPWLAAKVHQNVQAAVVNAVTRLLSERLPAMIQQHQTVTTAEAKSKEMFYTRWPQLKDQEVMVLKAGKMFRELNPNAAPADALEAIGKLVCDSLGIPVTAAGASAVAAIAPAAPAAPAFRPAGAGAAPGGAPPSSDNVFTQLAEELIQDGE